MQTPVRITRLRKSEFHTAVRELDGRKVAQILEPQLPLEMLSRRLSENLATPAIEPVPDCVKCGVCCKFALIVPITLEDSERLAEYISITADDWDEEIEIDRSLPRDAESGYCVHLAVGTPDTVGCKIYDERPSTCRDFEAGSDRCHEYRRIYRIEPQLSESDKAAAIERLRSRVREAKIEDVAIIPASKISKVSFGADGAEYSESTQMKIFVFLADETPIELHCYDMAQESWLENDLVGSTLDEARVTIASRQVW